MRRVAVTGIGVISPLGNDPDEFFTGLAAGRSGIARLPAQPLGRPGIPAPERPKTHVGAAVSFDPDSLFPAPRLRMLDRVSQFALAASAQAVRSSGLEFATVDKRRAGVFIGTGMGGAQTTDAGYYTLYAEGSERVKPYSVLMAMTNAAASWVGIEYGLSGPNLTYSTACSSSAVAIGEAARRIAGGEVDMMIAGGSEAPLNIGTLVAWDALKTLAAEDAEDAATSCKPFARNRSGLVLGEGAAMVILEEWQHAHARGAHIHAEFVGYGLCTDATHITRPSVEGQAAAMRLALASASMPAADIGYINAHGTATLANDAVETAAIKQAFGDHAYRCPVSSTKSMHGHLLGAAGALEFVASVLALERKLIPPTINLAVPDPECDLDFVPGEARAAPMLRTVMSNSFAFGGTNATLICRTD
ncbi:MAG: beta-ketoacyl-[acyl-carrier-protein] synthase family protein [Prolixibacteraceae bacterium]|nr:beta-ketoacyl-[acyl-carrier-protein] synthase family protein [Burkholderiales bacterium]